MHEMTRWLWFLIALCVWGSISSGAEPPKVRPADFQKWNLLKAGLEKWSADTAFACQFELRIVAFPDMDSAVSGQGGTVAKEGKASGFLAKFGRSIRCDLDFDLFPKLADVKKKVNGRVTRATLRGGSSWHTMTNDQVELQYHPEFSPRKNEDLDAGNTRFGNNVCVQVRDPKRSGTLAAGADHAHTLTPLTPLSFKLSSLFEDFLAAPRGPMPVTGIEFVESGKDRTVLKVIYELDQTKIAVTAVFLLEHQPPVLTELRTFITSRDGTESEIRTHLDTFQKCMGGAVAGRVRSFHLASPRPGKDRQSVIVREWIASPTSWRKPRRSDFVIDTPEDVSITGLVQRPAAKEGRLNFDIESILPEHIMKPGTIILRRP